MKHLNEGDDSLDVEASIKPTVSPSALSQKGDSVKEEEEAEELPLRKRSVDVNTNTHLD